MAKRSTYQPNRNLVRKNGKIAFSSKARAIADKRSATSTGRIDTVLGKGGPFSTSFKEAIKDDYADILERPHLEAELKAAKRIMQALERAPDRRDCRLLLNKMRSDPRTRKRNCVTCPIWKHEQQVDRVVTALNRYVFNAVFHELHLLSVVFSFSENLEELSESINQAKAALNNVVKEMTARRRGVVMLGSFEFDLVSKEQLTSKQSLSEMTAAFGKTPPDAGGWVLTGHFFVRVPHHHDLRALLKQVFPTQQTRGSKGKWNRIRFDKISKNKELTAALVDVLGYAAKYPAPLFKTKTKGREKYRADRKAQELMGAFFGGGFNESDADVDAFNVDAAIRQWALFVDSLGEDSNYYSVESAHAQKWYSESEMAFIRDTDYDMTSDGQHRIEIHRDTGPFNTFNVQQHLKGKTRRLMSRKLRYDEDWVRDTDMSGYVIGRTPVSFDRWIIKPKKTK